MPAAYEQVVVESAADWRAWLDRNHATSPGIWLVTYKKGRGPHIPYDAFVDEAICYGWVDGQARSVDADRSARLLTPRRAGSAWSKVNKARVERLTADGQMHPAGLAAIERARADGSWLALDEVEAMADAMAEPDDLRAALDAEPSAREHWDAFPRSARRAILEWVTAAKTEPTRLRRVQQTVDEAAAGRRANQWQPKRATQ